jgi:hypothetical protein
MSELLDKALESLEKGDSKAVIEALIAISEIAAVNRTSSYSSDIMPEANAVVLTRPELEKLQKAIIRFIEKDPNDPNAMSAFFALGKFGDKTLEPMYAQWLEYYFNNTTKPAMALGQILAAMNISGIQVVSGSSFSADDYGKNLSDAAAYLRKTKSKAP